jgi:nucleoside-triphosphatase
MNNIIITGDRRNTTAIEVLTEIKNLLSCKIGGYWVDITKDDNNKNVRIFDLTSLYDSDNGNIFFRKDDSTGISKLNIEIFNTKGVDILDKSFENADIIIMNEIGFLESKAYDFTEKVINILDSPKAVVALLKGVSCPYIESIRAREDVHIFDVSKSTRENIKKEIISQLKTWKVNIKE